MKLTVSKHDKVIFDNVEVEQKTLSGGSVCYVTSEPLLEEYLKNGDGIDGYNVTTEDGKTFMARVLPDLGTGPRIKLTLENSKIMIVPEKEE